MNNRPPPSPSRQLATLTALAMAHSLSHSASAGESDSPRQSSEPGDPITLPDYDVSAGVLQRPSSPKFTAPLVDTPQTFSVVPSEVFSQQGATSLSDVLRNTPGITFAAGEGGRVAAGDSFYMRGFDTSNSIFVDGVRDTGEYSRDVYNIEQVEIAKGPAGADTGRGGSSGYVNLSTKVPHAEAHSSLSARFGMARAGRDDRRLTVDLNQPLNSSPIAGTSLRLNALWQDSGTPGREYVSSKVTGLAPSLAVGLGTSTRVYLLAAYNRYDDLPDSGLPAAALPGGELGDVDQTNYYGLVDEDFDQVENASITARVEHDLPGGATLSNQLRYADTDRDALTTYIPSGSASYYDPDSERIAPRRIRNQSDNEILSNLTNLSLHFSTGTLKHSASAGLEINRERQYSPEWTRAEGPSTDIRHPDAYRKVDPDTQTPQRPTNEPYSRSRIDTAALYAFDTVELAPRFLLSLSVRAERYAIDYETLEPESEDTPAPRVARLSKDENLLSWKAGLTFKPTPDSSLYLACATSQTPPGSDFTLRESSATRARTDDPLLSPQKSRNFEIGYKRGLFDNRLSASLALYHSENLNVASIDASTLELTQDIRQVSQGVELGISGRINAAWLVYGGIGYIDTDYQSAGTTDTEDDGAQLRFTPRLSGNLWTTYTLAPRLTIGGGVQYSDSVARSTSRDNEDTATSRAGVPSYWLANAMAAYALNEHLTLRLNIDNLFDAKTYRLNNNGGRYYPGTPRSFVLSADIRF